MKFKTLHPIVYTFQREKPEVITACDIYKGWLTYCMTCGSSIAKNALDFLDVKTKPLLVDGLNPNRGKALVIPMFKAPDMLFSCYFFSNDPIGLKITYEQCRIADYLEENNAYNLEGVDTVYTKTVEEGMGKLEEYFKVLTVLGFLDSIELDPEFYMKRNVVSRPKIMI